MATLSGVSLAGRDAGTYSGIVGASFAATPGFQSSGTTGNLIVSRATASIAWPFPAPITHAAPLGAAQPNAVAAFNGTPLAGAFVYVPPAGTVLNAGINQILSASFEPADATNYESVTGNAAITVNPSSTNSIVQSSSTGPSVFGAAGVITATVAAVTPGTGTPTGSLQFSDNGTPIGGPVALASGIATLDSSTLTVGTHTITAHYIGSGNYNASTGLVNQTVLVASSTTTIVSSASASVYGQSVTLTATVAPVAPSSTIPTGTVTFNDGGTLIGTATLDGAGQGTVVTATLSVGAHVITATYSGDAGFSSTAAQSPVWQQLLPTGAGPDVNSQQFVSDGQGNLIMFGGCGPTGCSGSASTFTLRNAFGVGGTAQWGQIPTVGGNPGARHAHVLAYDSVLNELIVSGGCAGGCFPVANSTWKLTNANGLGGTPTWSQVIVPAPPGNGFVVGQFAAVDPMHSALMIFGGQNGGGSACSTTGTTATVDTSTFSWASLPTSGGPPGAQYLAMGGYDPGSNRLIVANGWGCGTFNEVWVLTHANGKDAGFTPTWMKLLNQGAAGSPPGGPAGEAAYSPGRNTMFLVEGGSPSASKLWRLSNANGLDAGGAAATPVWTLATTTGAPLGVSNVGGVAYDAASDRVVAQFTVGSGIQYWILKGASGSAASLSQAVTQANTTTSIASNLNPSMFGQSVTLAATVAAAAPGAGTPTGTVTFRNGATTLGTAALDAGGQATITTSSLSSLGSPHGITVVYGGDTNFTSSTSSPLLQIVNPAPPPTAAFTMNPNPAACNQTLTFNGIGSSASPGVSITNYAWDFGDGTTATGAMTNHAYHAYGAYTATLTVSDNNTPPRTGSLAITVSVDQGNQRPVASTGGPYVTDVGAALALDGTGSSDPDAGCGDSIVQYAWDLDNDGVFDVTGGSPSVSAATLASLGMNTAGSFTMTLRVTDEFGATDTDTTPLTVYLNVPTASFTANPNPAACHQAITFNGGGSHAGRPDRAIVSYGWDFGDGTSASGQSLTHSDASYASYTATLTVTDNNVPARTAATTHTINVNQGNVAPIANAGGSYSVNFGSSVQLNGAGSSDPNAACGDQIVSYAWTIDGTISLSGATPTLNTGVNPLSVGVHNVSLTVTDAFGATSTVSTVVTVQRLLVSIEVNPSTATIGVGGQQAFEAIGHFNDNTTQILPSGNPVGGGGPPLWDVHLGSGPAHGLNVDACTTLQYPSVRRKNTKAQLRVRSVRL